MFGAYKLPRERWIDLVHAGDRLLDNRPKKLDKSSTQIVHVFRRIYSQ